MKKYGVYGTDYGGECQHVLYLTRANADTDSLTSTVSLTRNHHKGPCVKAAVACTLEQGQVLNVPGNQTGLTH